MFARHQSKVSDDVWQSKARNVNLGKSQRKRRYLGCCRPQASQNGSPLQKCLSGTQVKSRTVFGRPEKETIFRLLSSSSISEWKSTPEMFVRHPSKESRTVFGRPEKETIFRLLSSSSISEWKSTPEMFVRCPSKVSDDVWQGKQEMEREKGSKMMSPAQTFYSVKRRVILSHRMKVLSKYIFRTYLLDTENSIRKTHLGNLIDIQAFANLNLRKYRLLDALTESLKRRKPSLDPKSRDMQEEIAIPIPTYDELPVAQESGQKSS
ncbi:hypothetical protein J6590_043596 [Homalodisca vitripennis]|nr:hypothetical protein J6590_043596 [Homalodisca vitripennis]